MKPLLRNRPDWLLAVPVGALGAGLTAASYLVLSRRVGAGSDYALRLSVILPYVGVDRAYVLARSFALAALVTAWASLSLGLLSGARGVAPRPAVVALHRLFGLLTLLLVVGHIAAPFASPDAPYGGWWTVLVPFGQPAFWGGGAVLYINFGLLGFYLMVALGPTYYLAQRSSTRWRMLHRGVALAYGLAVLHALLLGTDFYAAGPDRVALIGAQVPVLGLVTYRLVSVGGGSWRRVLPTVSALLTAGAAALTAWGATGAGLGGFRL